MLFAFTALIHMLTPTQRKSKSFKLFDDLRSIMTAKERSSLCLTECWVVPANACRSTNGQVLPLFGTHLSPFQCKRHLVVDFVTLLFLLVHFFHFYNLF